MANTNHPPQPPDAPREIVGHDAGGWISGPCLPLCDRCGDPKPDDGNDWCAECEEQGAAEVLAALRMPVTGAILRRMYPGWDIIREPAIGAWTAEKRDGSSVRFLAAVAAWELGLKIKAAESDDES
jgi:hypothetical protein